MQIVIENNQNRVKDCYASSSIIDLTLRTNGEEKVTIMDSLGQFAQAGFDAPTVAPILALGSTTPPVLTASQWIAYVYVYAATERYPYVQNAVSGGGDISPRSNPSPLASIQLSASGNKVLVTCTNSLRVDITRIWIYRTEYYATQEEAETAAEAGLLNFLTAVINNAIPGTIDYLDATPDITGGELIEVDNYSAPQAALCLYAPPYFYMYGNQEFKEEITVTASGLITLPPSEKWFDGRNGQTVTMDGITSGGFDGYGGYYFKWLTNTTAQLCLDIALTQNGPVNASGTTIVHIKGESTTLYRSKPNNPLSWGETETIGEINVPHLFAELIGGGRGTAMAIVPILNLLKLDTEGPNKTYVLSLNAAGTPTFLDSKREISNDFSTSNHWSQFVTKGSDGNSYLWFFDYKFNAICQADGAVNTSVSSKVFETLRNLSVNEDDRKFSHGIYDSGLEISCVWLTTSGSTIKNNLLIVYHQPTNQWSTVEQRDVLCSFSFLDRVSNSQITLIGTDTGRIGQAFAPDYYWDWLNVNTLSTIPLASTINNATSLITLDFAAAFSEETVGLWCYIYFQYANTAGHNFVDMQQASNKIVGSARISAYTVITPFFAAQITFDKFIYKDGTEVADLQSMIPNAMEFANSAFTVFPCLIFCNCCKYFPVPNPFEAAKITQLWICADEVVNTLYQDTTFKPFSLRGLIAPEFKEQPTIGISSVNEETVILLTQGDRFKNSISTYPDTFGSSIKSNLWYSVKPFSIDKTNGFRLSLENIGYGLFGLYNYQLTYDV